MAAFCGIAHNDGISEPMLHLFLSIENLDFAAVEKVQKKFVLHVLIEFSFLRRPIGPCSI
jgi:hypothetical protein